MNDGCMADGGSGIQESLVQGDLVVYAELKGKEESQPPGPEEMYLIPSCAKPARIEMYYKISQLMLSVQVSIVLTHDIVFLFVVALGCSGSRASAEASRTGAIGGSRCSSHIY